MLGDEDFGPVAEDNLALIDADEKKIEIENQFMHVYLLPVFVRN